MSAPKKPRVATRVVDGVRWRSLRFGRWVAEVGAVPVQVDATYFRATRTGWNVSVNGEHKTHDRTLERAMRSAARYATKG